MLYYLEELKKLNVEFLESTEKTPADVKKNYLKCIFTRKIAISRPIEIPTHEKT